MVKDNTAPPGLSGNREVGVGEVAVGRRAVARNGVIVRNGKEVSSSDVLYKGTVRVVTEADIAADPRLVSASVVAGQLYDFSNLPSIRDGEAEANVEALNDAHAAGDERRVRRTDLAAARPVFTSEEERTRLGISSEEEIADREKADKETRDRIPA